MTLHPFQDGTPYPWNRPTVRVRYEVLRRDITTPGQIALLMQSHAPNPPALNPLLSPA